MEILVIKEHRAGTIQNIAFNYICFKRNRPKNSLQSPN
jgi:hypothetical protein